MWIAKQRVTNTVLLTNLKHSTIHILVEKVNSIPATFGTTIYPEWNWILYSNSMGSESELERVNICILIYFFIFLAHQDCFRHCLKLWLTFWLPLSTKLICRDQQNGMINFLHSENETNLCRVFCFKTYFFQAYYVSCAGKILTEKLKKLIEKPHQERQKAKQKNKRNLIAYILILFFKVSSVSKEK